MFKFLRRCCESKRECLTYTVIILWSVLGVMSIYYDTNLVDLAAYFVSLTGFVAAYIFSETTRASEKSSIFLKGENSRREVLMYIMICMWLGIGVGVIIAKRDLVGASAYFAALTPFVGSYMIGATYKQEQPESKEEDLI